MAKSTKNSENRIFVANRKPGSQGTFSIAPFNDTLEASDGGEFSIVESAEQKADVFMKLNSGSAIVEGAVSVEDAIEKATAAQF